MARTAKLSIPSRGLTGSAAACRPLASDAAAIAAETERNLRRVPHACSCSMVPAVYERAEPERNDRERRLDACVHQHAPIWNGRARYGLHVTDSGAGVG